MVCRSSACNHVYQKHLGDEKCHSDPPSSIHIANNEHPVHPPHSGSKVSENGQVPSSRGNEPVQPPRQVQKDQNLKLVLYRQLRLHFRLRLRQRRVEQKLLDMIGWRGLKTMWMIRHWGAGLERDRIWRRLNRLGFRGFVFL